jgi:S-DNA-T family DNA segregation ATPase FtsK/SpoIIIE
MAQTKRAAGPRPRTAGKPAARTRREAPPRPHLRPELVGLGLLALGLFFAALLWVGLDGGWLGGGIAGGLRSAAGHAAYVLPLPLMVVGVLMLGRSALVDFRPFRVGLVVAAVGLMLALGTSGGGSGRGLHWAVAHLLGGTGATILGSFTLIAGALLLTGASVGAILRRSGHAARRASGAARRAVADRPVRAERLPRPARTRLPRLDESRPEHVVRAPRSKPPLDGAAAFPDVVGAAVVPGRSRESHFESPYATDYAGPAPSLVPTPLTRDPAPALVTADHEADTLFDVAPLARRGDYRLPDRKILQKSKPVAAGSAEANERIAKQLVETLAHFGVDATVVGMVSGPRVTRYELQLAPGTKVSKVAALKDDLSYALATTEIRILAPIPGKQAVGVEIPSLSPNLVTLGDIFDDLPATASPLSVWLGKDISGSPVWADLARMPHLLIAGTTGSGKSGCINAILSSILLRATPDEVRLILIDPKRVELNYYESIPHLLTPVVSAPKEASAVLANCVAEMERRYERLSVLRARNLPEANRALRSRGEAPYPYLLVVIDELADLMMVSPQAVEDAIIRLAQKSRAVGIHLVLATQRPSVDVITGMIKANVPSRIAFAVSSMTDSRVILDGSGAESLLGQGDMLFKPLGTSRLQRVQGAYISEEEVALIVEQCRRQRAQELDESLLELPEVFASADDEDLEFDPDEDQLLERAIEIVVQTQTASVSLIQRRLRVGYTRAGRLIDMLERRGIISGYEGSKPRRVLIEESQLPSVIGAGE